MHGFVVGMSVDADRGKPHLSGFVAREVEHRAGDASALRLWGHANAVHCGVFRLGREPCAVDYAVRGLRVARLGVGDEGEHSRNRSLVGFRHVREAVVDICLPACAIGVAVLPLIDTHVPHGCLRRLADFVHTLNVGMGCRSNNHAFPLSHMMFR